MRWGKNIDDGLKLYHVMQGYIHRLLFIQCGFESFPNEVICVQVCFI